MPRRPELKKEVRGDQTYWTTRAGGQRKYFGNCSQTSYKEANQAFIEHLADVEKQKTARKRRPQRQKVTVQELMQIYLESCTKFSKNNIDNKTSILKQFCSHRVGSWQQIELYGHGQRVGDLPADRLTAQHLAEALDVEAKRVSPRTKKLVGPHQVRKLDSHVNALFNWAANPHAGNRLPTNPFRGLAKPYVPPNDLTEAELITDEEYQALLEIAEGPFRDLLQIYYHTGARTGEPVKCRVRDWSPRTKQLTLGEHKRSKTLSVPMLRRILVSNQDAHRIVMSACKNKGPEEFIFLQRNRKPWDSDWVSKTFKHARAAAGVRDHLTVYSLRHLWITTALMRGAEVFKVAKLAGTSAREIERTYGHFVMEDLEDIQKLIDEERASPSP